MRAVLRRLVAAQLFAALAVSQVLAQAPSPARERERQALSLYPELLRAVKAEYGAEVPHRDLVYASINGMLRTLDPHSIFLTPEAFRKMAERQRGTFFGIGCLVSMRSGRLIVISPIEGAPAWRVGMRTGDVIATIDGEPTEGMKLDEAVGRLKGPKGTEVHLGVDRAGLDGPLELTLIRAEILQETVRYAYLMTPEVGYLRLTDFSRSTGDEIETALARLRREGMKKLLLDLRSNGGGLLNQVVRVADHFVPAGEVIVGVRGRVKGSRKMFRASHDRPDWDLPLVVLVNHGTASAAEILAGAIQDHDRGLLVGTSTWGKGLVQTVYKLSHGSGIALTTARYHTPSGRMIQRDYSSYYDYYDYYAYYSNPDNPQESREETAPAKPQDRFFTAQGRKVLGGGGIRPDLVVELGEGDPELAFLFATNAFLNFTVDYEQRHRPVAEDWRPGTQVLIDFQSWLRHASRLSETQIRQLFSDPERAEYVLIQIEAEVKLASHGTEASHRVLARRDPQIRRALEVFEEAGRLLKAR